MARKTKQQAGETRRQIIDAALTAFSEQGVSATSLVDIAKQAGVTLMNPLMILVKIIKLRWIHILSYDQM
uniref:TetR family transcriptional regulator n=1 Tax=Morganella morganii TaxID=582 RepID=UPI003BA285E5